MKNFEKFENEENLKNRDEKQEKPKRKIRNESPPRLRPGGKKPWRTILTAFFLFFAGLFFVITGYIRGSEKGWQEVLPFYILGTLLLIPGLYHTILIFLIWREVEGYSYDMLPKMDD